MIPKCEATVANMSADAIVELYGEKTHSQCGFSEFSEVGAAEDIFATVAVPFKK